MKVFSVTLEADRLSVGERITRWMDDHPECRIVDTITRQSSDARFHCLTIILFFAREAP